jgi:monofunctional biosynthetic peptidoglycan transglycosylase
MSRRRAHRKLLRILGWLGLGLFAIFVAFPFLSILALRWVPPATSAFMLERQAGAWLHGKWNSPTLYAWVGWDEISPHAKIAVIASEDQRFPLHDGFDREAIEDALNDHKRGGKRLRGASTISQQVAKNLFLWPGRSFVRKGLEAYLTLLLETLWPKRRILEVYLNIAEFGEGTYGVYAASRRFYGKPALALTRDEAARLAAVLPSPRRLRAERPTPYVQERTAWILGQMGRLGGEAYLQEL